MADTPSDPAPSPPNERAIPGTPGDKREHPRFIVEGTTTVLGKPGFLASLGFGPIRHPVINLSQGGAMVRVGRQFSVESRHEVRIEIPKCQEVVETVGEIRWCAQSAKNDSDYYVGIRFVDLPAAEQQKLAGMCALFTSGDYKARSSPRKDVSSVNLKPPRV
jgi:hypothetical protein